MGELVALRRGPGGSDEWVRTAAIAERFDVHEVTIRRWVRFEQMPSKKVRRVRLFNVTACDLWMQRRSA